MCTGEFLILGVHTSSQDLSSTKSNSGDDTWNKPVRLDWAKDSQSLGQKMGHQWFFCYEGVARMKIGTFLFILIPCLLGGGSGWGAWGGSLSLVGGRGSCLVTRRSPEGSGLRLPPSCGLPSPSIRSGYLSASSAQPWVASESLLKLETLSSCVDFRVHLNCPGVLGSWPTWRDSYSVLLLFHGITEWTH